MIYKILLISYASKKKYRKYFGPKPRLFMPADMKDRFSANKYNELNIPVAK